MRFKIHFTVNGHEDSIIFEGDTVADCREQWDKYAEGKPTEDMWSEEL